MTKRKLIDYCNSRESEVCNDCDYIEECAAFIDKTGYTPQHMEKSEHYTEEEL